MEYGEFVVYVRDIIRRNKAYELQETGEGTDAPYRIQVRVQDAVSEREATLWLDALYEDCMDLDKGEIRARVRQILPWDGRNSMPLTCAECRRILGAERSQMFESLRVLRQAYARRENVAPYIIFSNQAILAMCQEGPETLEGLQALPGVGAVNSVKYGQGFLELIRYHNQRLRERNSTEGIAQSAVE